MLHLPKQEYIDNSFKQGQQCDSASHRSPDSGEVIGDNVWSAARLQGRSSKEEVQSAATACLKTRIGWAFRCSLSWMGLPSDELLAALQRGQFAPAVREHFMGGVRSRVNGTPTFFINGQRHEGAYEFEFLVEAKAVVDDIEVRLAPGSERIDREQVSN